MITIYHNPRWGKSRESVKILKEGNYQFNIVEYLKYPINIEILIGLANKLNLRPKNFIRRGEKVFKEFSINQHLENDNFLYDMMLKYPILIERPIVIRNNKAIIARPPEKIIDFINWLFNKKNFIRKI